MSEDRTIRVTYRNHAGVTRPRLLRPRRIWFGRTPHHEDPQWLVEAFDAEDGRVKDFTLLGFLGLAEKE